MQRLLRLGMRLTLPYLLKEIEEIGTPVGAVFLSQKLSYPPATIGRLLKSAEEQGYLKSVSNKGRMLTHTGMLYLKDIETLEEKEKAAKELADVAQSSSPSHLLQILQVRRRLEPYAVSLACAHITDQDIEALDNILFERDFELRNGRLGDQQDLAFHLKIAELSGNTIIYQLLHLLLLKNNTYTQMASLSERANILELTQHDDIFQALRAKDSSSAETAMEAHIDKMIQIIA